MPANADFANYCCDLLASIGPCKPKRMFGGFGISTEGLTIALVVWDTLFLKANAQSAAQWLEVGCKPFTYEAKGKTMQVNYYSAPADAMESAALMQPWARLALEAALAAQALKKTPGRPKPAIKRPKVTAKPPKAARKSRQA